MDLSPSTDAYRCVLERAARPRQTSDVEPPADARPIEREQDSSPLANESMDTRYGDACAWAIGEGLVKERDGALVIDGKSVRGGSLQQASDYLRGRMHGNVDFPGRNDLRALLHSTYRRHKSPGKLPFRVNKQQRAVASLVQKQTRQRLNAWIDSLSDEHIRQVWSLVDCSATD